FKKSGFFGGSHEVKMAGTDLLGVFAAGNSSGIVVPDIVTEHEREVLEEKGVEYMVLESKYTAFGNLLLCNDEGCLISRELEDRKEEIGEFLDVPVKTGTVAGLDIPGSCGVATNQGVLLHRDASEEELERVEEALGVEGDIGTVNFGTPYVHSGVLADSENVLVGNDTTGPEVQRVQEALGLL
ncbi:MAG: translation initiation factor IF-6, partial [Candidatus Nanohaloarchaea archaeon]|nr:translation initiation factor IF-6 [Candidatus Nanohaloarchaea archaeon]